MGKKATVPTAPQHLTAATRDWWSSVVAEWRLEPHHLRLLTLAAEAWDRSREARAVLDAEGLTYVDRFNQPRSRPEIAIERDARLAYARLVRELNLDADPPAESRPPRIGAQKW